MEPNLFQDVFYDSVLRKLYSKMIVRLKVQSVMGLFLQIFIVCFTYLHFKTYLKYQFSYPSVAKTYLVQTLFEGMTIIFSATLYSYLYRCGNKFQ